MDDGLAWDGIRDGTGHGTHTSSTSVSHPGPTSTTDAHRLLAGGAEHAAVFGLENEPPVGGQNETVPVTVEAAETGDTTTVTIDGVGGWTTQPRLWT